jgi:short-subunit dehydrogenase
VNRLDLSGAHAVVTGASRGIGAALTRELAARGCRVSTVARSTQVLETMAAELGTIPITADLANLDSLTGLLERIERDGGPVDLLVNNAAHPGVGALADRSCEELRAVMTTNLLAPMELARQAAGLMRNRRTGTIVTISSVAGEIALPHMSMYGTAKAGLSHFTNSLQRELAPHAVHVLLAVLGEVDTGLVTVANEDPVVARITHRFARLPVLSAERVAKDVLDAVERRQRHLVKPGLLAPTCMLRRAPTRLADVLVPSLRA